MICKAAAKHFPQSSTSGEVEGKKDLQGRIDQIKAESSEKVLIASLDCAHALKTYSCSGMPM
jgi:hypothetical protein